MGHLLKATPNDAIRTLLPQNRTEIVLSLMMAFTAGYCEEVIFRGYLQRQFAALTHVAAGGILLQGIAFGAAHGYQGWKYMLIIAVFGTMFGQLAHWRGTLRPGDDRARGAGHSRAARRAAFAALNVVQSGVSSLRGTVVWVRDGIDSKDWKVKSPIFIMLRTLLLPPRPCCNEWSPCLRRAARIRRRRSP
jgi:hypothetical protein